MNTKLLRTLLAVGALTPAIASAQTIAGTLNGTFDPTGGSTVNTFGSGLAASNLTTFRSDVSTAFTNGFGGVWNSTSSSNAGTVTDSPAGFPSAGFVTANLSYGVNKTLVLAGQSGRGLRVAAFASAVGSSAGTGTQGLVTAFDDTVDNQNHLFSLSLTGAGLVPGERIIELGMALVGRSGIASGGDLTITASFSGGGFQARTLTGPLSNTANAAFFHFIAPAGESITAFRYQSTNDRTNPFDDISIITIPEPGTYAAILAAAGLGVALWRRRR
jgi:hypothetical protein